LAERGPGCGLSVAFYSSIVVDDADPDPRLLEATRRKEDAIQAQCFGVAAQWREVERKLERGEEVEWPPVIQELEQRGLQRMASHWYLMPFVMLWALASILREVIVTTGRRCEVCGRRVYAWNRPMRGYGGRYSTSAAGDASAWRWATVTHRACFFAQAAPTKGLGIDRNPPQPRRL